MTVTGLLIFQSKTLTDLAPSQCFRGCRDFVGPYPSIALDVCIEAQYKLFNCQLENTIARGECLIKLFNSILAGTPCKHL